MTYPFDKFLFLASLAFSLSFGNIVLAVYHKPAPLPQNTAEKYTTCPLSNSKSMPSLVIGGQKIKYLLEEQVPYESYDWEKSLPHLDSFKFTLDPNIVLASVIDVRKIKGKLHYAYLANGTHNQKFQPWSSSKFLATLSALRMMRSKGVGGNSKVNGMHFGDIVTAAHTGLPSGSAHGRSNVHGTWLQDVAGRQNSNWLISNWLRREGESFLGGYSSKVKAGDAVFNHLTSGKSRRVYHGSSGASRTRLSTLTLAEALRRIATHNETKVPLPGLQEEDVKTLFYGKSAHFSGKSAGGMLAANGNYYRDALGGIANLNQKTQGKWRIFTKTGSADRKTGQQQLVNGVICLPGYDGGRLIIASIFAKGPVGKLGDVRLKGAIKRVMNSLLPGFAKK